MLFLCLIVLFTFNTDAFAATDLPLPRFVSLRSNQINMRTGPGIRYPVEWVYLKSDLPVEITAEFENWRKIKDSNAKEGWVHRQMLSGRRTVKIRNDTLLLRAATENSRPLAKIEQGAIGKLILCPANVSLCKIKFLQFQGWVDKKQLYGVYPNEVFE